MMASPWAGLWVHVAWRAAADCDFQVVEAETLPSGFTAARYEVRPSNKDLNRIYFDFEIWGISNYKNVTVEGSFLAVSKPILEVNTHAAALF